MTQADNSILPAVLEFTSSLIWPAVFVWLIVSFRPQVIQLLNRLTAAKVAGSEFVFQPPAQDSAPANPQARVEIAQIDSSGFFTAGGIRDIVNQSGQLPKGERAEAVLLLFSTPKQHTWLVASPSKVAIVLDDEGTRADNRLVQRVMDIDAVLPLTFGVRGTTGTVAFGSHRPGWYYSTFLFPTTESLDAAIKEMISAARESTTASE